MLKFSKKCLIYVLPYTRYEPNFFSSGVTSCGKTLSRKAKCLRLGLLSGTRLGFMSKDNRYSHCDLTEKLLRIDNSFKNGFM